MDAIANRKFLITGEKGFVGRHLANKVKMKGGEVVTLTNPKGECIDIRDWERIKSLKKVKGVDIVYHLAAITYVPYSWREPRKTYEVNVLGTLNILELCRIYKVNKLIFVSSYVYGVPKYIPVDENHPVNPSNPYMRSKVIAEELCRGYHQDYGLNCIIFRPFNIYGEGQNENFLVSSICSQIVKKKIVVLKDSRPRRDYLYISDMVDACIKSCLYKNRNGFDVFNIGFGKSYSVKEVVKKAIEISGKKVKVEYKEERRKSEIMNVVADVKKARQELNWRPEVGLEEGLKFCLDYYREND